MIADSTILITFAKINRLDILVKLYNKIYITEAIYDEIITQGTLINATDSLLLKDYFDQGKINLEKLKDKNIILSENLRKLNPPLGKGESEAISLAIQRNEKLILLDESYARRVAEMSDLRCIGSLRILTNSFDENIIDEKEIDEIIKQMINNKFRIGADILNDFWDIFEQIKKNKKK